MISCGATETSAWSRGNKKRQMLAETNPPACETGLRHLSIRHPKTIFDCHIVREIEGGIGGEITPITSPISLKVWFHNTYIHLESHTLAKKFKTTSPSLA